MEARETRETRQEGHSLAGGGKGRTEPSQDNEQRGEIEGGQPKESREEGSIMGDS